MEPNEIISSGILEAYATGMASPQEVIQVKGYLNNFVEVREELDRIEADLEIYANLFAVQPDAAVKNKIFARINVDDKRNNEIENGSISQASRAVIGIPIYWKYIAAASPNMSAAPCAFMCDVGTGIVNVIIVIFVVIILGIDMR